MKHLILILLTLTSLNAHASGNGSGGVGNGITIDDRIVSIMPDGSIRIRDNQIQDAVTGEPLLEISKIRKEELGKFGNRLSKSKLGLIQGYEYIPEIRDQVRENFWITCDDKNVCTQFKPLSKTNLKAVGVIGSLKAK